MFPGSKFSQIHLKIKSIFKLEFAILKLSDIPRLKVYKQLCTTITNMPLLRPIKQELLHKNEFLRFLHVSDFHHREVYSVRYFFTVPGSVMISHFEHLIYFINRSSRYVVNRDVYHFILIKAEVEMDLRR